MFAELQGDWIWFSGVVAALLLLDLGFLNRRSHALTPREAWFWSAGVVALALLFGAFLLVRNGHQFALEYFTGYLIELSLSVDNLFVFLLIFQYFAVPGELQPRVLKWGILGAMIMRGIMIGAGVLLLNRYTWIVYLFGAILILTGIRMLRQEEIRIEPERNPLVRLARRVFPVTPAYEGSAFLVHRATGGWLATPLLLVVLVVEWSDVLFAIDSIPAIFAVTRNPFIVYSSNVFAILGLRALFFVLASAMDRFVHLKTGVALILVWVGAKMTLSPWLHVPIGISLGLIVLTLTVSVALSVRQGARGVDSGADE